MSKADLRRAWATPDSLASDGSGENDRLDVEGLLPARKGHFRLESGHHGDLWLDLELLFFRPAQLRPLAEELARALSKHAVEAVCGPLIEGAFVASLVAPLLDVPFTYTERRVAPRTDQLFPVRYVLPPAFRPRLNGQRVAVVNDVINAGSAVRGTLRSLRACGAEPIAIATLAVLGDAASRLASEEGVALETLASFPNQIWVPTECPLCARQVPLSDPGEAAV
jgi:orotate phosphoribosyltransferase